jgi:hypothetical protein
MGRHCPDGCTAERRNARLQETSWRFRKMAVPFEVGQGPEGAVPPYMHGWKCYSGHREPGFVNTTSVFLASPWTLRTLQAVRAVTLTTYCNFQYRGRLHWFPVLDSADATPLSAYAHPRNLFSSRTNDVWCLPFRRKESGFLTTLATCIAPVSWEAQISMHVPNDFIAFDRPYTSSNY